MARKLNSGTRRCSICDKYADQRVQHGEYYCESHFQDYEEEQRKEHEGGPHARN